MAVFADASFLAHCGQITDTIPLAEEKHVFPIGRAYTNMHVSTSQSGVRSHRSRVQSLHCGAYPPQEWRARIRELCQAHDYELVYEEWQKEGNGACRHQSVHTQWTQRALNFIIIFHIIYSEYL